MYFGANCALASISAFLPTIITTFGYSALDFSQIFAAASIGLTVSHHSERARAAAHRSPVRRGRRLPVPQLVRLRPPAEPWAVCRLGERSRCSRLRVSRRPASHLLLRTLTHSLQDPARRAGQRPRALFRHVLHRQRDVHDDRHHHRLVYAAHHIHVSPHACTDIICAVQLLIIWGPRQRRRRASRCTWPSGSAAACSARTCTRRRRARDTCMVSLPCCPLSSVMR